MDHSLKSCTLGILLFQADGCEIATVRKEKRYVENEDVVGGNVER